MDKVLVMGIGNLLLTDDGVGVHAAQTLAGESWPENVTIMEAGTFTQDVFYLFKGFAHVLILDIVHGHAGPGTVYHLTENQLVDNEKQRLSIHDIDLLDSLRMAEMLHGSRPNLTVMGMEPADYTSWSMELSPVVQERFPAYLDEVRKEILRLSRQYAGNEPDSTCEPSRKSHVSCHSGPGGRTPGTGHGPRACGRKPDLPYRFHAPAARAAQGR